MSDMIQSLDGGMQTLWSPVEAPTPEKILLLAILERAAFDAYGSVTAESGDSKARISAEAMAWFASDRDTPGSFLWVCEYLGMSASRVRSVILKHRAACEPHAHPRL